MRSSALRRSPSVIRSSASASMRSSAVKGETSCDPSHREYWYHMPSPSIARFTGGPLLIQLAVEVETLENELDRRGNRSRMRVGFELTDRAAQLRELAHQPRVPLGRHTIADLDGKTMLEARNQ